MQKPKMLVTAAAGKTGMASTLQLLHHGYPVRAFVRRADARSETLRKAGAEIAVGSLEDFDALIKALKGVQRAYFCPPLEAGVLRRTTLFAAAAEEARLEVAVVLSQWLVHPTHPALHSREKWLAAKVWAWNPGVEVVTVNPGWFADNYFAALESIAQFGLMSLPLGEGLNAPPSTEDIARVIVGALVHPAPHIGKRLRPTGPRLLSPPDIAATFGKVLGRKVSYQNEPLPLFLKVARSLGLSDYVIANLHDFLRDYQRNSFGIGAPTDTVLEVGGAPPEEFEAIVRRTVAGSLLARRSAGATARAAVNLLRALLTPAPDLEAFARRSDLPGIESARLAADSAQWHMEHAVRSSAPAGQAD